jgi:hypothetical protein
MGVVAFHSGFIFGWSNNVAPPPMEEGRSVGSGEVRVTSVLRFLSIKRSLPLKMDRLSWFIVVNAIAYVNLVWETQK